MKIRRARKFRWMKTAFHFPPHGPVVDNGCWIPCFGPDSRYPLGGVLSTRANIAQSIGDGKALEADGLQWRDPTRSHLPFQKQWRNDWPRELWPPDRRRLPPLVRELAVKFGMNLVLDNPMVLKGPRITLRRHVMAKKVKRTKKKVSKRSKRERKPKDPNRKIRTGVRFEYTVGFAKALRERSEQSGRATRKEIKAWAVKRLERAMAKVIELAAPAATEPAEE